MSNRANPFRTFPVLLAFLLNLFVGPLAPIAQNAMVSAAPSDGIEDYAQCQIGDGAGLDCAGAPETPNAWTNGILNATHNDYSEDEVVPQRLQMELTPGSHTVTIRYMTRKGSSDQVHAYDYLATWNHTYVNADRCQELPSGVSCLGGSASTLPIPSDTTSVTPGGPQPTSAHELPQADRQFVMYGGTLNSATAPVHGEVSSGADKGSDYATITVTFTVGAGGQVQLLWGGHLASGFGDRGWGEGLGAASINGGPYHMIVDAVDGESIGNRDNQIMSNAIEPLLPTLAIDKTADAASVSAGSNIGFTITVTNTGEGNATNVTLSDPLPAGGGVNWEISPAYSGPGTCQIDGNPPAETLNCAFGTLAAGASASVHVQSATTSASCGAYPNTATADADNFDPVQASATTSVLCADLSISKTTSTPVIYAGQTAIYTITVSNSGAGTATGVAISDSLPSGLTWTEDPDKAECSISGGNSLSCSGITIAAGGSFSVTVKGVTDAGDCPSILNRATFTSGNDGSGASHPEGQGAQVTVLCPDTSVVKTGNGPLSAGDTATFTIVVTAGGTGTNQNVTLADNLPAGLTWSLGNANDEGDCSINAGVLSCSFGDMEPGGSKTVVLNSVTDAGECPSISNTATVNATIDTNSTNNSSTAQITVNCGDLTLQKTPDEPGDTGGTVNAGEVATFRFVLANQGSGSAYGVTLEDTLPATDNGWNLGSSNDEGSCLLVGNDLDCSFGTLAPGASKTVEVWTTTTLEDCGTLDNPLAEAHSSNDGNPTDSGAIEVTCPDLGIGKSTDTPIVTAGDKVSYTVKVSNDGDGDAENVVISDTLPAGISWAEDPDSADCSIAGGVLTCTVDIPAGEDFSVTVSGWTDADDCPSILNRATFTSDNAGSGASHPQGQGVEIQIDCPDVGVEKTAFSTPINAGDEARYTVTVTAGGTGTSEGVSLHDDLPSVDGTWAYQITSPEVDDECAIVGNDLDCSFGDMTPGQTKVVTLTHTTTADDCGTLYNDVSVSAEVDTDTDENLPGNTVDDVAIEVNCPDVSVDKTGSGTVNATDSIYFEITVSNDGDGDAYDFEFSDTLPDVAGGWTLVAGDDGCALNGLALTCSKEVFEAGDSFTLRVEADTDPADCGELPNLASASASNESDEQLDNNSDGHTIVVECPALSATKTADDDVVSAGQQIGFTIDVANADDEGTGTAYDVELNDPLPAGSGLDWAIDPADEDCEITGAVGAQVLECSFGDLEPGDSVSVHVVSDTAPADCATYPNEASVTAENHDELNPSDDTTVECPGLNISKLADNGTIDAGELASYTIVVWNVGPGTALDASWSDDLPAGVSWSVELQDPDGDDACASSIDGDGNQSASCDFGDLAPSDMAGGKVIVVSGLTDRADCGELDNTAFAYASNDDTVEASASITVKCPTIALEKVNDQPEPVLPGTVVSYTVTVTVSDGPAKNVTVTDLLPLGLDAPTSISDAGSYESGTRTITWNLGDLADGSYDLTYQAAVSEGAGHGDELVNVAVATSQNSQCPDAESPADECVDDSTVTVRVPELVIDKAADTEEVHFVFDAEGNVLSVDPEEVTWTLTYTLTNGPVTNAVITDPLPDFLTFVSASDGGVYDDATRTITWEFAELTESGSVTFVTTVDADAPETAPIVNVATIVSDQTPEDDGEDSIIITSESEQGGNPTPTPSVPDTALVFGPGGEPISIPVELMLVLFLGSLGALAFANVRAVRRRR